MSRIVIMKIAIQISLSLVVACLAGISCRSKAEKNNYELPLTFSDVGLPMMAVTIADATIPFVVDSGSNRCLIDAETAKGLQLPPICSHSGETVIQHRPAMLTHVHDVSCTIGGHRFVLRTLVITDMPGGDSHGGHGLLGMDFLRSTQAVIDIKGARLLIGRPASNESRQQ